MDIETTYHLGIAMTAVATCLAAFTGVIYSWVCTKTRPLKLPTVALTALLWVFFIEICWRLYVVTKLNCAVYSYPMLGFLMVVVSIGYGMFLVGTFRDSIILNR